MYESCYILWWGLKNKTHITFIESIKIRLHKSNLYYCIKQYKFNKTKYFIDRQKRLTGYSPALIKFTGDSSYPYIVKYKGYRYAVHTSGRCREWIDYQHT